jgi:hypothetical protein
MPPSWQASVRLELNSSAHIRPDFANRVGLSHVQLTLRIGPTYGRDFGRSDVDQTEARQRKPTGWTPDRYATAFPSGEAGSGLRLTPYQAVSVLDHSLRSLRSL